MHLTAFPEVWLADFEFYAPVGERPKPICLVAREWRTGRLIRHWLWDDKLKGPPYPVDEGALFVAYYASAELGCHLALGWPLPVRILDLCVEFKWLTSGLTVPCGRGLLGAMTFFGLDAIDADEKGTMRELAMTGGPFGPEDQTALLDYCQSDVDSLLRVLPQMLPKIDVPRALLRGRYMAAVARMEHQGG